MRRIVVAGAGQAGLVLALGLQRHGYAVTVVTDRDAETIRDGRLISNQCVFHPALTRERALGINFWDGEAPEILGASFGLAGDSPEPAVSWQARFDHPAQSVDQRVKVSAWLTAFAERGGEVRIGKVTPDGLEEYAREFDLVLVAAGRGPQFDALFSRDDARSPHREPQRTIGIMYLVSGRDEPLPVYPGLTFGLSQAGELFGLPIQSVRGPVFGLGFFGVPGGPMDVWDGVTGLDEHFELAMTLLRGQFPWVEESLAGARPSGPLDVLRGRVLPIVRDPVGTLPSGAKVLAMGDAAVTNDPIAGQGANMAAHAAAVYERRILDHGDRPFDEAFLRGTFAEYWEKARHATRLSNDLLAPPPDHVLATLEAAQTAPEVARRFANIFSDPVDYARWLTDEDTALAYLASKGA
ncbi:styrene monooxygenase/indole monooxygenase family protein [Amycolatopsis decaplanina]|uniref:Dehydrogenase/oxygenase subunit (Flavoprotein) n=1 Tax=Amycolatopsis decaplanina DSM 44594 TaxID=1284240 RepID=M2YBA7_9PSEU|nr:styrene monooxygenase/indole monooxygenase family protein [Amycolatopsis decaplanina]EME52127.1 dehydrogenase/oxygenase subunit (flavoprotein) [Amycolatopsis decaplanina DSM 44594]